MSSKERQILNEIRTNALFRIDENSRMIGIALQHVAEDVIWKRPNENSNSIGNLILHLCGNISQYIISSLGESPDIRERDTEFEVTEGLSKIELLEKLLETTSKAKDIISLSTAEQFLKKREVQGFNLTGIGILIHVVEHYSYHTGQVAFWVKQLKNKSLGFYTDIDLTKKNT